MKPGPKSVTLEEQLYSLVMYTHSFFLLLFLFKLHPYLLIGLEKCSKMLYCHEYFLQFPEVNFTEKAYVYYISSLANNTS